MAKEKVYKITVKIQPPSGYKIVYQRGLCVAKKEQEAKDWTLENFKSLDYEGIPVVVTIHKCELTPSQFIFNTKSSKNG